MLLKSRLVVLLATIVLAGCANTASTSKFTATSTVDATSLNSGAATTQVAAGSGQNSDGKATPDLAKQLMNPAGGLSDENKNEYRITPLDMLQVAVFQVPDLSKTVRVAADGKITLPLIGDVVAAGKTAHELETEVATELGAKYLQSPEVSIFVSESVSQRITVEGAVAKPGIYPIAGQTTLMQVVALSGGLNDTADSKAVVVFRSASGKREAAVFDYKAIRAGTVDDPVIQAGDIVAVDQSGAKAALKNIREAIGVFNLFAPLAPLI